MALNQRTSKRSAYFDWYSMTIQSTTSDPSTIAGMGERSGVVTVSRVATISVFPDRAEPGVGATLSPERRVIQREDKK